MASASAASFRLWSFGVGFRAEGFKHLGFRAFQGLGVFGGFRVGLEVSGLRGLWGVLGSEHEARRFQLKVLRSRRLLLGVLGLMI